MNKWLILVSILPLILLCFLLPPTCQKNYVIFPGNPEFDISTQSDSVNNGNSKITAFSNDQNGIFFQYVLKKGFAYPYCSLILKTKNPEGMDSSRFNTFIIEVKKKSPPGLEIRIKLFIPGFSTISDPMTYRIMAQLINTSNTWQKHQVQRKNFSTPSWWYNYLKMPYNSLKTPDYRYFAGIELVNEEKDSLDITNVLEIRKISFERDYTSFYYLLSSGIIAYLILSIGIWIYFKRRKKSAPNKNLFSSPQHLELENHADAEAKKVFDFILKNYQDPELSLSKINLETGIPEYKISRIVQKFCDMPFKNCLNQLRIKEAKHLLENTDYQITEIAFAVGYNDSGHFTRIFKEYEKITPKEYQKKHGQKN
jgi:AraC-like DNA-binding protein